MPSVATALDIARLYEELRECVRANDQEGVKRVFAELVRARRPVPEILAEVKSLTKEREKLEERGKSGPEKPAFEPREWPVQVARSDSPPIAGSQVLRDLGSASVTPQPAPSSNITPRPVSEAQPPLDEKSLDQPSTALPKSAPEPALPRPSGPLAPSFGREPSGKPEISVKSPPERFASGPNETPKTGVSPVQTQHPSQSNSQSTEPPVETASAAALLASTTATGAPPAPHESTSTAPARPQAALPEAKKPDSSPQASALQQILARTLAAEPSPAPSAVSQPPREIEPPATLAASEQIASETSAHVSGRGLSLRRSLDLASDNVEEQRPARRAPIMALALLAVVIIGIGGIGWFWLSQKSGGQVAGETAARPEATASTPETKTTASAARRPEAVAKALEAKPPASAPSVKPVAVPTPSMTGARERPPTDTAAASSPGNAVAPAPSVNPAVAAASSAAASATPNAPQSDPTSAAAKLEPPKEAAPMPAAPMPPANAPTSAASPEPRVSAAEAAALLSRGDEAFGVGDIASARLFYERAADAGSGAAALQLGETYDPNFLDRAKLRSVHGDLKAAIHWYRRAKDLGVAEADILLKGIQTK